MSRPLSRRQDLDSGDSSPLWISFDRIGQTNADFRSNTDGKRKLRQVAALQDSKRANTNGFLPQSLHSHARRILCDRHRVAGCCGPRVLSQTPGIPVGRPAQLVGKIQSQQLVKGKCRPPFFQTVKQTAPLGQYSFSMFCLDELS